ncbi:bifunctional metallophosphatase/5'-nucleotidase [Cohnella endophytica]|uniref:Bifunctional metallophosphatase/5'-nucleotidase n=1 Tax=Cohnella endophytica TaxID=2419778 RepID=A0A494XX56_9BACL|nr:bifunctional metallophosphatase/5'-nucleotidase [Cohnella endophytica]
MLHTNDLHSHFEEASRIARYIAQTKDAVDADRLIVVDCGDFLDRARMETEGTKAAVNVALLERIGYDAVAFGNNEGLSYTLDELNGIFHETSVPIVCANMTMKETGAQPRWMVPTLKLVKSGIRLGFIGATAAYESYYKLLGWNVADPFEIVSREVERLRPEVDVLIVLSHLGLRFDERLAEGNPGIDLILGGHTHHLLEVPLTVGRTAICAAGKFGAYVGHLELEIGADGKLGKITGGSKATEDWLQDAGIDDLVGEFRELAKRDMNRQIALLQEPLDRRYDRESPLPTLLAGAVRRLTGAELGLVNAGQFLEGLPAGPVTEETIHAICPSPINPCAIKLDGKTIVRSLEESLLSEFQEMEIRGFGFRGKELGSLCVDGLAITADLAQAPYRKVKSVYVNGVPLDPERLYTVGTLDMFSFGVGYLGLKEGRDVRYFLPDFIRDLLSKALNEEDSVADCRMPRWRYE